jgi:acyl-CoA dehydrogenase
MSHLLDRLAEAGSVWPRAYARGVRGGVAADRVGVAFAAGYQAALRALVPSLVEDGVASLAASEAGGAHPRAIASALTPAAGGFVLNGTKTFATQGPDAEVLLVLANAGTDASGHADLRLVRVRRGAPGLVLTPSPPTPFCPEIGHAQLVFTDTPVASGDVLPGDGWTDWVKPFRTVEDVHVHGAVLAYVLGVAARHAWSAAAHEELAALLVAFGALAARSPTDPATHLAVAGAIALARRVLDAHAALWESVAADERDRWRRDQPLLRVAEKARTARTAAAWDDVDGVR